MLQYNFSANVTYRSRVNYANLSAQSIFSSQSDAETTNQHYLQFLMAQVARNRWGIFEVDQIQANPAQGYDQRYVVGGGAANFLIEQSLQSLVVSFGAVYNREYVTDSSEVDNSAEAMTGIGYQLFKRNSRAPKLKASLQVFPSITDSPRIRGALNVTLSWSIISNFQFSVQITDQYDSQPPGENGSGSDVSVVNSVGYTF